MSVLSMDQRNLLPSFFQRDQAATPTTTPTVVPQAGWRRRLTFALGAVWLCVTGWSFATDRLALGYVLGGVMSFLMLLLATVHFCIVSEIVERIVGERGRGICVSPLELDAG